MTTRGSSGHVLPLAPFGHAARRAGHEVLVAAQHQHRANVAAAGLDFAGVAAPPPERWMPLMASFGRLSLDEANALMIGEYFARLDTRAALPDMRRIVEDWHPDLIVRESMELAATLVADLYEIPLARVGLGLAAVEEIAIGLAAPAVDDARRALGLSPDPNGDRLRAAPYLTVVPEQLEHPAAAVTPTATHRFAHGQQPGGGCAPELPDWWPGNDDPLVYLSFGSVAAGAHMPYFPALYHAAIDVLAALPVRVLVTIGNDRDVEELGTLPANVHAECWVAHDLVAEHAAAVIGHGGYGTTLGTLRRAVPAVVLPLFSIDQWVNAAAVAAAGAGIALDADRDTRTVLALPSPRTFDALGPAVMRVVDDPAYRRGAQRIAAAMDALPAVDDAVDVLTGIEGLRQAVG